MTYDEALRERLEALLRTLTAEDTSDLLVAEYSRINEELSRTNDEREFK